MDRVLELVQEEPGRSDRELTDRLIGPGAAQQSVSAACRRLAEKRLVNRRLRPDGRIGNFPTVGKRLKFRVVFPDYSKSPPWSENAIKYALEQWFLANGWQPKVAWDHKRGADIEATRADERWIVEAKGIGLHAQARGNYFVSALGMLLQRMNDSQARYSLALPDHPQYQGLWDRLPGHARKQFNLSVFFVSREGSVDHTELQGS